MTNFEEALIRIEKLEEENQSLKEQLEQENIPVDSINSQRLRNILHDSRKAMHRYTAKLRRDIKKYKKDSDGKT